MSEYQDVWPKTLTMRAGRENADVYVMGGKDENVLVAVFVDGREAEAWIQASKQFGDMIRGRVLHDTQGDKNREIPHGEGGSGAGGVRETHESGSSGGSGPAA